MILTFEHLNPKARTLLRAFLNIRPLPALQSWENIARKLIEQGFLTEACYLLELAAKYYGADIIRRISNHLLPVPDNKRGRPFTGFIPNHQKPAIYALRDHFHPIQFKSFIGLRSGANLLIVSPTSGLLKRIHVFTQTPAISEDTSLVNPLDETCISAISTEDCLIYSDGTNRLHWVDLSDIQNPSLLPHAFLECPNTIHRLYGPLDDGTFFITYQSDIPILSDVCVLCRLDIDKIRQNFLNTSVDIQKAAIKWQILENTEQSLNGDICIQPDCFMTCRGGMQNSEVRFLFPDGSWTTRFIHESPVIRMIQTESGPVSLDSSGQAYLWSGTKVIDDALFSLIQPNENILLEDNESDFSLNWKRRRLYLTQTPSHLPSSKTKVLSASHSYMFTPGSAFSTESFIKKISPLRDNSIVMLSDGEYYFWNNDLDCVEPVWQLSKELAKAEDWRSILDTLQSPDIESDPRILVVDRYSNA